MRDICLVCNPAHRVRNAGLDRGGGAALSWTPAESVVQHLIDFVAISSLCHSIVTVETVAVFPLSHSG